MTKNRIEVITSVERRRIWSAAEKARLLAASVHDQVDNLFRVPYPEKATAEDRRAARDRVFMDWHNVSGITAAL